MSATDTIQVGDIGTVIRLTIEDGGVAVDVSSASEKEILLRSPAAGATALTKAAAFTGTGTDGQIQYAIIDGDLDIPGNWSAQGKVVMPGGTWYTTKTVIVVRGSLD